MLQIAYMRCLGNEVQVKVDLISAEIKPNDWMVLCSDGLWKVLGATDDVTVLAIKFDRNFGGTEEEQC